MSVTEHETQAPALLRLTDAARYLSVSRSAIYRLLGAGQLAAVKIGDLRISRRSLDDFIERNLTSRAAQ